MIAFHSRDASTATGPLRGLRPRKASKRAPKAPNGLHKTSIAFQLTIGIIYVVLFAIIAGSFVEGKKNAAAALFDDEDDFPDTPDEEIVAAKSPGDGMPEIKVVGDDIEEGPTIASILSTSSTIGPDQHQSNFPNPVLAFVTPWANRGYDIVKWYRGKFTHVAPVWYQIRPQGEDYILTGGHDVDAGWVEDVRIEENGRRAKVVPRFVFEGFGDPDYVKILRPPSEEIMREVHGKIIRLLISECQRHKFDGLVLEIPMPRVFFNFLMSLGASMESAGLELIIVSPPNRGEDIQRAPFAPDAFEALVSRHENPSTSILFMTYDFSNQSPGPNAPMSFIDATISPYLSLPHSDHIFMGLAMYGYLYCNNQIQKAILARDWLEYLEGEEDKQVRVKWDSVEKEGYWEFTNIDSTSGSLANCRATFPTLESIQARLDYAKEKGIGVALWETGQGLDHFYNLL